MFAVIEADLDYDYLAGLDFVAGFSSAEEADGYIREHEDVVKRSWDTKRAYMDQYLDTIEDPTSMDYKEWIGFCRGFGVESVAFRYYRSTFKKQIQSTLIQQNSLPRGDYHPPIVLGNRDLFIVEIPS